MAKCKYAFCGAEAPGASMYCSKEHCLIDAPYLAVDHWKAEVEAARQEGREEMRRECLEAVEIARGGRYRGSYLNRDEVVDVSRLDDAIDAIRALSPGAQGEPCGCICHVERGWPAECCAVCREWNRIDDARRLRTGGGK